MLILKVIVLFAICALASVVFDKIGKYEQRNDED